MIRNTRTSTSGSADRSLIPSAVEEFVRWVTPFTHFRRTATRDTEISGVPVKARRQGRDVVRVDNQDEDVFNDPSSSISRGIPTRHQGFGGGGPLLASAPASPVSGNHVLIEETVDRVPPLELAGPPDRVRSALLSALTLPVRPR